MSAKKERVLLGMSGGVDSSVAGYLLREQGYDVVGVTMKVWPQDCISRAEDKCCGPQAIADARGVAHSLGIPHYVVDEADQFETRRDRLFFERIPGRPDAESVRDVQREAEVRQPLGKSAGARLRLHRHRPLRDHRASPRPRRPAQGRGSAQGSILFPLQPAPAATAPRARLRSARWRSRRFARSRVLVRPEGGRQGGQPGNLFRAGQRLQGVPSLASGRNGISRGGIYDLEGNFLAEHDGIEMFTIGQRKGLPGGSPSRVTWSTSIR